MANPRLTQAHFAINSITLWSGNTRYVFPFLLGGEVTDASTPPAPTGTHPPITQVQITADTLILWSGTQKFSFPFTIGTIFAAPMALS